ncbi:hypothetical protein [Christiangramia portivictoriae]|uniref:hypothetical protein n=1 Tax=Christiangramia portivictoriae TaxID=326069 RepID=UPI00041B53B9|nr:hypothetical protein [Christiangramia portivictoriae]
MKTWFSLFVLTLIAINVGAFYYLDQFTARYFQLFSTASFFIFFLFKYKTETRILLVLALLTVCDGLIINYEDPLFKKIIYAVRILSYLTIISYLYPYLSKLKLNLFTLIIVSFVIGIDVYLLHDMAVYIPNYSVDIIFTVLFYMLGLTSLALVATCISYLNRYANTKGFLIVLVSFCFVLSDITFYNAYYLDFKVFYYVDKIANVIGIASLIIFAKKSIVSKTENLLNK